MTVIRETLPEQIAELEAVIRDYDRRFDEIAFALGCRGENCEHEACIEAGIAELKGEPLIGPIIPMRAPTYQEPAPFSLHVDHDWVAHGGTAYCEDCHVDLTIPTEAEREAFFLKSFGMTQAEWRERYGNDSNRRLR